MPNTIRYVDFPSSLAAAGRTIEALEKDDAAEPLSIHTSAGCSGKVWVSSVTIVMIVWVINGYNLIWVGLVNQPTGVKSIVITKLTTSSQFRIRHQVVLGALLFWGGDGRMRHGCISGSNFTRITSPLIANISP